MPPPSPLVIATGAVTRLLKEEASYHKELQEQEAKVKAQEEKIQSGQDDEEGNATYILKQHVRCLPPTLPDSLACLGLVGLSGKFHG